MGNLGLSDASSRSSKHVVERPDSDEDTLSVLHKSSQFFFSGRGRTDSRTPSRSIARGATGGGKVSTSLSQAVRQSNKKKPIPMGRHGQREIETPVWNDEESGRERRDKGKYGYVTKETLSKHIKHEPRESNVQFASNTIDLTTDRSHSESINIVYPAGGGNISLSAQSGRIQDLLHAAIEKTLIDICFIDAFPDALKETVVKSALSECADALGYQDISQRLRVDKKYATDLSKVPAQRVYNLRHHVKEKSDGLIEAYYDCHKRARRNAEEIKWLLASCHYIYPCEPETGSLNARKPFLHEGIIAAIRQMFFHGRQSAGIKNFQLFKSSIPEKPNEKEIPKAMCAFASAGVFCSISEYSTGSHRHEEFSMEKIIDAYNENMILLTKIQRDGPLQFHALMHRLFREASSTASIADNENKEHSESAALAIVDIAGMDVE